MSADSLSGGGAIAAAAARRGWDSDELADSIQVNRSMVASWLDGSVVPPDRLHRRLEEALEFTPAELAALKGSPGSSEDMSNPSG
jgi:ribosome-binding protein aMBF1 (putative translation factor)